MMMMVAHVDQLRGAVGETVRKDYGLLMLVGVLQHKILALIHIEGYISGLCNLHFLKPRTCLTSPRE